MEQEAIKYGNGTETIAQVAVISSAISLKRIADYITDGSLAKDIAKHIVLVTMEQEEDDGAHHNRGR